MPLLNTKTDSLSMQQSLDTGTLLWNLMYQLHTRSLPQLWSWLKLGSRWRKSSFASTPYRTMISFMEMGFQRYRVSVIDMYPHARSRFKKAGLPLPYGDSGFAPSQAQLSKVDDMLRQAKQFWEGLDNGKVLRIESCAEPGLTEPIACGCISDYDLNLLGFSEDAESSGAGYQRKGCMCYAGKTELLKHKTRCPHGCLYCYWKDMKG